MAIPDPGTYGTIQWRYTIQQNALPLKTTDELVTKNGEKKKKTVLTNKYLTVILILKACIISYQFPINYIQDANNAQVQTIKWIVLFLAK